MRSVVARLGMKVVRGFCHVCPWQCPSEIYVRDDRVVYTRGNVLAPAGGARCVKGEASVHLARDPYRLRRPLRRDSKGRFRPISWIDAFALIADKLATIRDTSGPQGVVWLWHLDANALFPYALLSQLYGTPNCYGHAAACDQDRRLAAMLTYGHPFPVRDFAESRLVLLWGQNPLGAPQGIAESRALMKALASGAKLIVVDPVRTTTATKAHEWIAIRPGSDGALALAMCREIIERDLYDGVFVERWTVGFEELREHLRKRDYSPRWAEPITGVPAPEIARLAREFALTRPGLTDGFKGLVNYSNGLDALRAVFVLNALTGNVDGPGNLILKEWAPLHPPIEIPEEEACGPSAVPLHVAMGYPLAPDLPTQLLPDAVLEGKPYDVRAVFFHCTNPRMSEPNTRRYTHMLEKLEFSVAVDLYLSETAQLCDLVLPEASFYERAEVRQGMWLGAQVLVGQPAVTPVGESLPLYEIVSGIAEAMGLGRYFKWDSWEDWGRRMTANLPIPFETLKEQGFWNGPLRYRRYQDEGFGTPSGRIELASSQLAEYGHEPLPCYSEPRAQPSEAYRYRMVHSKLDTHCNVNTQTNPYLLALAGENWVELHPGDAVAVGVSDGDRVELSSPLGSVVARVRVTGGVRPGVVCVRHGHGFGRWTEGPGFGRGFHVNPLIGTQTNPISGGVGYNECFVSLRKR